MEVGFGGLLDSTNVVNPVITAITSIGIDHTKVLGNTIEEISFQKAGIIKSGIPIVYNHINKIIEKTAEEKKSPVIFTDKKIKTNLIGKYQEKNAAIAFRICKYIKIPEKEILEGLQKVQHFGRLQYITYNLLIDGAHNEAGLEELKKYLLNLNKNIKLCFAQKKGKNGDKILKVFNKEKNFILVESENKLMVESAEKLKETLIGQTQGTAPTKNFEIKTPEEIYELSLNNKNNLYVVFGSLYMIGDFLKFVK
ncbi:MAG: hypothetical protein Q9M97_02415 [Candidatus Gracilibacteria bacterium]|nr:hypothetical protein [Candidatus Gracilibacteria bacterium]